MKSLQIQRFKAIGDATLHWHERINVITGPNNSGKTTVLEALSLWVEGFSLIAKQAVNTNKKRGTRRGDWYLDKAQTHHTEVISVRSPEFHDLFYREEKDLCISATFSSGEESFCVPINIRQARGGQYDFSSPGKSSELNQQLNSNCTLWPQPFRALFASPIAAVHTYEEFQTPGKIEDVVRHRQSAEVIRNRIFRLKNRSSDFQLFTDDVGQILTGRAKGIEFEVSGDPGKDVIASVKARSSTKDRLRDISLLGSGSLQVIEVLLNLYLESSDLDLILLDEPDSHIHRDIQRRLLEVIEAKAEHAQVFLSTHNESLIRSTSWDKLFHLEPAPMESPKVLHAVGAAPSKAKGRVRGMLPSPLRSPLSSVGAETALDLLNALEADHFILVEGTSDAALIDKMLRSSRIGAPKSAMFWSLGGVDNGLRSLDALKTVLGSIQNGTNLWEKAVMVLDRDLLTEDHARSITAHLLKEKGIRAHFWDARVPEACLLSAGPSPFAKLLYRVVEENWSTKRVTEEEFRLATVASWQNLHTRLSEEWKNPDIEHLGGQLRQRAKSYEQAGLKGALPSPVTRLLQEVLNFHKAALDSGRCHQSASKEDVRLLIEETFKNVGFWSDQIEDGVKRGSWFYLTVDCLDSLLHFPTFKKMSDWLAA